MDAKIKRKWVKALRSGEFKRGTAALCVASKNGDKFCCLGVLAYVQGVVWDNYGCNGYYLHPVLPSGETQGSSGYLDDEISAGLGRAAQDRLADMNDRGASFRKIADWIDANL